MIPLVHFVFKVLFLFSFSDSLSNISFFIFLLNIEKTPEYQLSGIPACLFFNYFSLIWQNFFLPFFNKIRSLSSKSALPNVASIASTFLPFTETPPCCTILLASERVVQSLESTNIVRMSIPSANLSASYSNVGASSFAPPLSRESRHGWVARAGGGRRGCLCRKQRAPR